MKKILGVVGTGVVSVAVFAGALAFANAPALNGAAKAAEAALTKSVRPLPRPACIETRSCPTAQAPTTSLRPMPRPEQVVDLTPYAEEGEPTIADKAMVDGIAAALREAVQN